MLALVLDASSAMRIVLDPAREVETLQKLKRAEAVYAPMLFVAETGNALWKYVNNGHIAEESARRLHADATMLVDRFVADAELFPEALGVAIHSKHPVYDALYVVTARRKAAGIMTSDRRLAALAAQLDIPVV
jgi:predicted nucleic acid-binding protein